MAIDPPVDGFVAVTSHFGPAETMSRAVAAIETRGMSIFARIDHAGAATAVGLQLPPTEVTLFGSPKAGTPLMQSAQTIGIDLPLKILVWQDRAGQTWLGYNDPHWLAGRHGIGGQHATALDAMTSALAAIAKQATT